jgi:hypothetical protein
MNDFSNVILAVTFISLIALECDMQRYIWWFINKFNIWLKELAKITGTEIYKEKQMYTRPKLQRIINR